jgi:ADP-ribosylation factor GTPase-activating protein 1
MEASLNKIAIHFHIAKILNTTKGNTNCVDCNQSNPIWTSLNFGTFVCLECAGFHRSLGVHITTVRSINLDTWNEKQVKYLEMGGNESFREYLASIDKLVTDPITRYSNPHVLYYW